MRWRREPRIGRRMVFASHSFLAFLAILLLVHWVCVRNVPRLGKPLLIAASFIFYAYWIPAYLLILIISLLVNHVIARGMMSGRWAARPLVIGGITLNLALIGYYKYAMLLVESLNWTLQATFPVPEIILPIGISFFTFQQISLLVDTFKGRVQELRFWDHVFFISFFPQLIAGPIVRQDDLIPQLRARSSWRLRADQLAVGIALFSLGLFKKSFLIDPITPRIDFLYEAAEIGASVGFLDAWMAAFGYGFQIYFDFSAYSDMAIGLGFMFGFRLPVNFFSPYKAESIRVFWRRWHITLSRFLRDYLFIPLGGSRHSIARTIGALLITMSLGGLWHGASWTFVAWGLLHGIYLSANHLWRALVARCLPGWRQQIRSTRILAWPLRALAIAITFVAVNSAWILFRSSDFDGANRLFAAMLGRTSWREYPSMTDNIADVIPLYLFVCWVLPNTMQIFARSQAALPLEKHAGGSARLPKPTRLQFSFSTAWAATTAVVFVLAWFAISSLSPFIYFVF